MEFLAFIFQWVIKPQAALSLFPRCGMHLYSNFTKILRILHCMVFRALTLVLLTSKRMFYINFTITKFSNQIILKVLSLCNMQCGSLMDQFQKSCSLMFVKLLVTIFHEFGTSLFPWKPKIHEN